MPKPRETVTPDQGGTADVLMSRFLDEIATYLKRHPDDDNVRRLVDGWLRARTESKLRIDDLDRWITSPSNGAGPRQMHLLTQEPSAESQPTRSRRPDRHMILDALDDIGWPTYSRELAQYTEARYGRKLVASRFGSLAADERNAFFHGRPQPVWLCFALTHVYFEPIKRLWARSDWPLERRIFGPLTGRVQHLKLTIRLCELAIEAGETASDIEMLRIIAADHARDLPGIDFRRGTFEFDAWIRVANDLLTDVEERDSEERRVAAERLMDRDPVYQLFGLPEVFDGPDQPEIVPLERKGRR